MLHVFKKFPAWQKLLLDFYSERKERVQQLKDLEEALEAHQIELPRFEFLFGLKKDNRGKIESHQWFFRGFC